MGFRHGAFPDRFTENSGRRVNRKFNKIENRKEKRKREKTAEGTCTKPQKSTPLSRRLSRGHLKLLACRLALVAHQRIDLFVCRCRHSSPRPSLYFLFLTNLSHRSSTSNWTTSSCSTSSSSVSSLSVMDAACRRSQLSLKPHGQSALCHGHRRQPRAPIAAAPSKKIKQRETVTATDEVVPSAKKKIASYL